jgi:uncharacterized protein with FMN-binding domain
MVENGPNRKVAHSLVALSSAAILAVYAAGYVRTRRAADRFEFEASRRKRVPVAPAAASPSASTNVPLSAPAVSAAPSPSASPGVTRSVTASPRPTAAPRAIKAPPIETASAAASPVPTDPIAQATPAERPTAPPGTATPAPFIEPQAVDGDEPPPPPAGQYKDGTYTGWGTCRHGDVQVELVIRAGRIAWASISKCYTRYPCSVIDRLVPEVVGQQGPPITYVSGASESSDALYYAVNDALSKAK